MSSLLANPVVQTQALPAQSGKGSAKELNPASLFDRTLSKQIAVRQAADAGNAAATPAAAVPPPAKSNKAGSAPQAQSTGTSRPLQKQAKADEGDARSGAPESVDHATEPTQSQAPDTAKEAKDKPDSEQAADIVQTTQAPPDTQVGTGGLAALLAQLQALSAATAPTAPQSEGASGKLARTAAMAHALGERAGDKGKKDATDSTLLASLAEGGQRQLSPATIAEPGKTDMLFSTLMETKQTESAATIVAPLAVAVPQRSDTVRSANNPAQLRIENTIFQPVGGDGWDSALGHQVVMMVSNQHQEVELQLNPPHLGPLDIKLSLDKDQASLTFVAATAPVREALNASLPRLEEMLAESGIQLAQSNVQTRSNDGGREQGGNQRQGTRSRNDGLAMDDVVAPNAARSSRVLTGLPGNVNLFV
ncbi:flagellar hook-length control protein FliK [Chitinimonas sp.]|uniref:flagellar hook-length control protein FliK n=1 Tax=Chitinimonas sp. TaxID=1934313 RepID=UPI0035B07A26